MAAFDAAGGFIVDLGDLTEPGEARPPAWGVIVSRYDPKWSVREDRLPDFAALVTTYGMEMFDDDGNPVLPAEAVAVTVEDSLVKLRTWSRMPTCLCGLTRCWWSGPTAGRSCIPSI